MTKKATVFSVVVPAIIMLLMVLDSKTVLAGTAEGLEMCLRTVIPALYPFIILTVILTSGLGSKNFIVLSPLGRFCGIPSGAEALFLLGLLGGYPSGAQAVAQARESNVLSQKAAKRMLGFCSNCGPSFLFGITTSLFTSSATPWILWGIHIVSALFTGFLLPGKDKETASVRQDASIDLASAIRKASPIMVNICAWIMLARCCIAFLDKWLFHSIPLLLRIWITGILELTNGCIALVQIPSEASRFVMLSGFLAFGGICVGMQTVSVTGKLHTGWYFQGKIMQFALSTVLASIVASVLYPDVAFDAKTLVLPCLAGAIIAFSRKKEVAFSQKLVYNTD